MQHKFDADKMDINDKMDVDEPEVGEGVVDGIVRTLSTW